MSLAWRAAWDVTVAPLVGSSPAIPLGDLGSSLGSWPVGRILGLVIALVLIRPVVPPVRRDLSVEIGQVLGFPSGRRGRVDTMVLWASAGVAVVLGGLALVAAG